jgi:hypothetical protein
MILLEGSWLSKCASRVRVYSVKKGVARTDTIEEWDSPSNEKYMLKILAMITRKVSYR